MEEDLNMMIAKVRKLTEGRPPCEVVGCEVNRSMSLPHSAYCYYHTIYDHAGKDGKKYGVL